MDAIILGFVRHAMTAAGVQAIVSGYFTGEEWSSAVGAIITLTGLALSAAKNRKSAVAR